MTPLPPSGIGADEADVVLLNKGGRDNRMKLLAEGKEAPREFFYGYLELARDRKTAMLSSGDPYVGPIGFVANLFEQAWSRASHLGIRLWHVRTIQPILRRARVVISFTDGYSVTLGLYFWNSRRGNRPFVVGGFHGLSDMENRARPILRPIVHWLIDRALRGLDHVFFFGAADREFAISRYRLDAARTSICRFGVDTEYWRPDPSSTVDRIFVAIGQDQNRDYDLLARAPTQHQIAIVTRNKVNVPPGRSNVAIATGSYFDPGALTDEKLRDLYRRALAVVVPLKDVFQPTGYSVTLQAMACGKPVVLSNIRGLWAPELIRDGENCLLVPPGDADALAAALDRLASDPALCDRLGAAARRTAQQHFGLANLAADVRRLAERGLAQER